MAIKITSGFSTEIKDLGEFVKDHKSQARLLYPAKLSITVVDGGEKHIL